MKPSSPIGGMEFVKLKLRETDVVVRGRKTAELKAILRTEELGFTS